MSLFISNPENNFLSRRLRVGLALASLLLCSNATAQDLFGVPGNPRLAPSGITLPYGASFLGEDNTGHVYLVQGGLSCHHRDDPDTVYYLREQTFPDFRGLNTSVPMAGVMTADKSGVEVAFVPGRGQFTPVEAVRILRVSCQDLMPGGAGPTQLGGTFMRGAYPLLDNIRSPNLVRNASGALCFTSNPASDALFIDAPTPYGVVCIDVAQTPPAITQLIDSRDLDAALDIDPRFAFDSRGTPNDPTYWTVSGLASARDGRIFFYAERDSQLYVVERRSDGTLAHRFGPVPERSTWSPLSGAGDLTYSPGLDAMVTQVVAQEHNWSAFADIVATGFTGPTWGWTGVGLRIIPLDAPGSGYLPLSRVVAQRHGCEDLIPYCGQIGQVSLFTRGNDTLIRITRLTDNPNRPAFDAYVLELDHDTLDLDDDQLSAAEEAVAGTWDTVADSDFGGTPDGVELNFAYSDPLDQDAEPARLAGVRGGIRYVPSPLIGLSLAGAERTVGIDNPVCQGGSCYGPGGVLVATYPIERKLGGTKGVISADGTFIMLQTAAGLERFFFGDAREELAVTAADLDIYAPIWAADALDVIPLDADRTIIASDGAYEATRYPAVVVLADGDEIRVLYDHAQAQRDSGLFVAENDYFAPLGGGVMASISVIGWNADTERLHFGVRGNWDSWLITLGLDGSTRVLGRGRALKGLNDISQGSIATSLEPPPMPAYLVPTGHGDYFASGAVMEPFGGYIPARSTIISDKPPVSFWGDVLLDASGYELVRYDLSVSPGDVLLLQDVAGAGQGAMLFKSGPRGGIAALWDTPLTDIVDIGGIDIAPDGSMRLCIADRGNDVVWELEPAGPGGVPELVRYTAEVSDIRDCAYDNDGNLSVLAIGPARVEVRAGDFGELVVAETLASAPEPIELVRKPDGENEVRVRDGLRGKAYLPDGRVVTMRADDMVLRIDDEPMPTSGFGERLVYQSATIDYGPAHPARVALGIRADGSIVVAPFDGEMRHPYALIGQVSLVGRTPDKYSGPLGVGDYYAHEGMGLTVVPGGSNVDPWTGRAPKNEPRAGPRLSPTTDGPAAPVGTDEAPAVDAGCAGGSDPGRLFGLIAVLLASAAVRRQRAARVSAR